MQSSCAAYPGRGQGGKPASLLLPPFDRGCFVLLHLPTLSSNAGSVIIIQINDNIFNRSIGIFKGSIASCMKPTKYMCACMIACSMTKIGCSQWTQDSRPSTVDPVQKTAQGTCLVGSSRSRESRNGFLLVGVPHLQIRHQHGLRLAPRNGQAAHLPPVAEQTPA